MIVPAEKTPAHHQPQPAASSEQPNTVSEEGASQADTYLLQTVSKYVGLKEIAAGILLFVVVWKIFEHCKKGDTIKRSLLKGGVCCNMFDLMTQQS